MTRTLLVNPWIHDFAAFDLWSSPLGLLIIGDFLKCNGVEVRLLDLTDPFFDENFLGEKPALPPRRRLGKGHYEKEEIEKPEKLKWVRRKFRRYGASPEKVRKALERIKGEWFPDFIILTTRMTYWYTGVIETVRMLKEFFPGVPIIGGGTYITLLPAHARKHLPVSCILPGRVEKSLNLLSEILGISFSIPPSYIPDLSLYRKRDFIPVLTSKGCPFRCAYCASSILFDSFEELLPSRVYEYIILNFERFSATDLAFYDDAFLFGKKRAKELLLRLINSGIPFNLHFPNALHARFIDREMAELLKAAGTKTLFIGLESSDPEFQSKTGGKVFNREFEESVRNLHSAGFSPEEIGVYLMAGLPETRFEDIKRSIDYVFDCGATPRIVEYSPIPGTPLWEKAVKRSPFPLEDEPLFHNNTVLPCRWSGFDEEHLGLLKEYIRGHTCSLMKNIISGL